jgi:FixJ family two-component response regulator
MYETLKSAIPAITARQREVVELIAAGCSNEEIGARLGISPRTAKAHSDILRQKRGEWNWWLAPQGAWLRAFPSLQSLARASCHSRRLRAIHVDSGTWQR